MKKTQLKRGKYVLKRGNSQLKRSPLKKRSAVSIIKETEGREEYLEQIVFFDRIWKPLRAYQRVCYETGEQLYPDDNGNPLTVYFHHVLPKGRYPQFRFSPWNIVLVSWATHDQYHAFPEKCPKIYSLYQDFLAKASTLEP